MQEFVLGVVSSLAASVLAVVGAGIVSRPMRRWLVIALSRLTGVGVVRSYRTQQEANRDLPADLARARWVRVLAGRGNELTRDSFQHVWRDAGSRLEFVEILLPDPDCDHDSWLVRREAENRRHDKGYDGTLLADQVRNTIDYVENVGWGNRAIELRLFNLPNICRVVVTDRVAYLTTYAPSAHGRNSPCLVFRNPSPMYDFALRIFSASWSTARTPTGTRQRAGKDQFDAGSHTADEDAVRGVAVRSTVDDRNRRDS